MTPDKLLQIMPLAGSRAQTYAGFLTVAMTECDIDSPQRQAAFLSQLGHESASLRYTEELADGSAYNDRADLGNTSPGDGPKYKGRGLIQITGKSNYRQCGIALGHDFIVEPQLLALPENACRSAAWFWSFKDLNRYADKDQYGTLTKMINGGYNGLDDRIQFWLRAREVLM